MGQKEYPWYLQKYTVVGSMVFLFFVFLGLTLLWNIAFVWASSLIIVPFIFQEKRRQYKTENLLGLHVFDPVLFWTKKHPKKERIGYINYNDQGHIIIQVLSFTDPLPRYRPEELYNIQKIADKQFDLEGILERDHTHDIFWKERYIQKQYHAHLQWNSGSQTYTAYVATHYNQNMETVPQRILIQSEKDPRRAIQQAYKQLEKE